MQKLEEIKDFTDVIEFKNQYDSVFLKDNRARESLNKTLETNYKAVFRKDTSYKKQWKRNDIDWCGEEFYAVTSKNRVVKFNNSEWAWFKEIK